MSAPPAWYTETAAAAQTVDPAVPHDMLCAILRPEPASRVLRHLDSPSVRQLLAVRDRVGEPRALARVLAARIRSGALVQLVDDMYGPLITIWTARGAEGRGHDIDARLERSLAQVADPEERARRALAFREGTARGSLNPYIFLEVMMEDDTTVPLRSSFVDVATHQEGLPDGVVAAVRQLRQQWYADFFAPGRPTAPMNALLCALVEQLHAFGVTRLRMATNAALEAHVQHADNVNGLGIDLV